MLRDKIKDENYFKLYLDYENDRIERFTKLVEKVFRERGPNDRGAKNGFYSLKGFYINKLEAIYSLGVAISEMNSPFKKLTEIVNISWNKEGSYVEILRILSIAIMLEIEDEELDKLAELVRRDDLKDYLVDFLIRYRKPDWKQQTETFEFDVPYKSLKEVIEFSETDKQKSVERLKVYLEKEWYKGHSDAGWYDSHKSKHNIYSGYWCWESGALVKILGLDDSILKDQQYYPYDMVHWKDQETT